jgi:hypothetical protein
MTKTVEVWCCGIAADHELGETDVKVYPSEESVLKHCPCAVADAENCAPRKLTVTFESSWIKGGKL